jgi:hypothetical protein
MDSAIYIDGDVCPAASMIADGAISAQGFGNIYAIVSRPDAATVQRVNRTKRQPAGQTGSVLTTWRHIPSAFDWSRLPEGLEAETAMGLIDTLLDLGPFGFRGPAAAWLPDHLTAADAGVRTAQVIAPGFACPSNRLIAATLEATGGRILHVTSASRSSHASGVEEPAHYRAEALAAEFAAELAGPGFLLLRHRDEAHARARYPLHAPMSTTVLAFHKLGRPEPDGRPTLVVERHGSLHLDDLAVIVGRWGLGLDPAPLARRRLAERSYDRLL